MAKKANRRRPTPKPLAKVSTGIKGVDDILGGGLPKGRPTLICGAAGSGKTMFCSQFLAAGAARGEPGVYLSFEETAEELATNLASLGIDVPRLVATRRLAIEHIDVNQADFTTVGDYDLEGLFVRIRHAMDGIAARRLVLDSLETLFTVLPGEAVLRTELLRLFRWLKARGVTAVVTAESGGQTLTRHGVEEYVADCVLRLSREVTGETSTRRMSVVKYRGSSHGENAYPFLVDDRGIAVIPITALALDHRASLERVSTGVPRLDAMLGGKGYQRGSTVLVSGTAGTGKSSLAAHFADATCRAGRRCLYFSFEESPAQILRNLNSIGIDLGRWVEKGRLRFQARRPTFGGLEQHLLALFRVIESVDPHAVVVDPATNLTAVGTTQEVRAMLTRLIDYLKSRGVTALFTALTDRNQPVESEVGISSLMDTWISLTTLEDNGERNSLLSIQKSRGTAHSNQMREFRLSDHGVNLFDVYTGPEGVRVGSARAALESRAREHERERQSEASRRRRELAKARQAAEAQVAALHLELSILREEEAAIERNEILRGQEKQQQRELMARQRMADSPAGRKSPRA